jgi:hypothetical protein
MRLLHVLQNRILSFLEAKEELAAFREWFAPLALDIDSCEDPDAIRAFYSVQRSIADFAGGFLSEPQLRQNLAGVLIPSPSSASYAYFGKEESKTGTSMTLVESASAGVGPALVYA